MKKKMYEELLRNTKSTNALIYQLVMSQTTGKKECASDQDFSQEDAFDFFEKNAKKSNMIEALKQIPPVERENADFALKEMRAEQKRMERRMRELERQQKKCEKRMEKDHEELYEHSFQIDSLYTERKKLEEKQKKLKKDMKLIKQIFVFIGYRNGICAPHAKFQNFIKRLEKTCNKGRESVLLENWRDAD